MCGAISVATSAMAGDPPGANTAASPPSADSAAPATPATTTQAAPPTQAPATQPPPATRPLIAIVVTQSLKDAKWNREWGAMFTGGKKVNNLAEAITGQTQAMLADMGLELEGGRSRRQA